MRNQDELESLLGRHDAEVRITISCSLRFSAFDDYEEYLIYHI
jgi:hypothetical protein